MTNAGALGDLTGTISDAAFASIADLARSEAGLMLPRSKQTMVQSRLRKRLKALDIGTFESYAKFVHSAEGSDERRMMISALTTNVSHFFRENHHFDILRDQALPLLVKKARSGQKVRIWSAGCSSGQEPYSISMLILEHFPELASLDTLILATDIDSKILEKARQGSYFTQQISGISPQMQQKYLTKKGADTYQVQPQVQRMIRFKELNLLADWPMKIRFDVIFCRNVVIYFDADVQASLWPRFQRTLAPDGWFFLGHSERVSDGHSDEFMSVGMTAYRPKSAQDPKIGTAQNGASSLIKKKEA